jgi:hypothetical protein
MSNNSEYTVKLSTIAQVVGYLIGIVWVFSETVRDVAYMRDQLTESVAPSLLEAKEYREEMTERVAKIEYEFLADKKAVWLEIDRLKKDILRLEKQVEERLR